jgi:hypothetical protein
MRWLNEPLKEKGKVAMHLVQFAVSSIHEHLSFCEKIQRLSGHVHLRGAGEEILRLIAAELGQMCGLGHRDNKGRHLRQIST